MNRKEKREKKKKMREKQTAIGIQPTRRDTGNRLQQSQHSTGEAEQGRRKRKRNVCQSPRSRSERSTRQCNIESKERTTGERGKEGERVPNGQNCAGSTRHAPARPAQLSSPSSRLVGSELVPSSDRTNNAKEITIIIQKKGWSGTA